MPGFVLVTQRYNGYAILGELQATWPRSSMDRAFGFYPKGCRFKSCRGHHLNSQIGCASIPPEITSVTPRGVCIVLRKLMQGINRWLEFGILAALLLAGAA